MAAPTLRSWATPLTIGASALMVGTGVLMFFDIVPGYVTFVHEWLSWVFVLGAGAHIVVNSRPFLRHLKTGWGRANVALFLALLVISTFSFGRITAPQLKWPISEALIAAPISILADLTRRDDAEVLRILNGHGIAATASQSVQEVSEAHGLDEFHVLGLLFLSE